MHWFHRSSNIQADAYLYRLLLPCGFAIRGAWVWSIDKGARRHEEQPQSWNLIVRFNRFCVLFHSRTEWCIDQVHFSYLVHHGTFASCVTVSGLEISDAGRSTLRIYAQQLSPHPENRRALRRSLLPFSHYAGCLAEFLWLELWMLQRPMHTTPTPKYSISRLWLFVDNCHANALLYTAILTGLSIPSGVVKMEKQMSRGWPSWIGMFPLARLSVKRMTRRFDYPIFMESILS